MGYTAGMHYNVVGTEVSITPELRTYVEKRLVPVDRLVSGVETARVDIELHFLRGEEGGQYRAEMTLHQVSVDPVRSEARGSQLHEAIDKCADGLARDVARTKKKRLDIVRRTAARAKDFMRGMRDRF